MRCKRTVLDIKFNSFLCEFYFPRINGGWKKPKEKGINNYL